MSRDVMYREVLVPLVLGDLHEAAILQACALASEHEGHVVALAGTSLAAPIAAAWAYYPAGLYDTLEEAGRATVAEMAEAAGRRLAQAGVPHEVRRSDRFWFTSAEMAALHARYADLTVFGVSRPLDDAQRRVFGGLLAGSGRPVLVVPSTAQAGSGFARVLVAWKSSREASRALHDALPLLQRARDVELLIVEHGADLGPQTDDVDADLVAHLQRHGVEARLTRITAGAGVAGEAILDHANQAGADLVVAGGYHHSRAREQVFGGVTRHLLEHAPMPVFFSH